MCYEILLPVDDIKPCPFKDRFSYEAPVLLNNERIQDIPVIVIQSEASGKYFVIENLIIFETLVSQGTETVKCVILKKVDNDSDAFIERLAYVFKDPKPFHILEQCSMVYRCEQAVHKKEGKDAFYNNGGDRKGTHFRKHSLIERLCEKLPYKKAKIEILSRFGRYVGGVGLEGLYKLLHEQGAELSIHTIHKRNGALKKSRIVEKTRDLEKVKKVSRDDIESIIGQQIYDVLFEISSQEAGNELNQERYQDDEENVTEDKEEHEINKKLGPLSEISTKKVKGSFEPCFQCFSSIWEIIDQNRSISEKEAYRLNDMVENLQKKFTDFVTVYYQEMR